MGLRALWRPALASRLGHSSPCFLPKIQRWVQYIAVSAYFGLSMGFLSSLVLVLAVLAAVVFSVLVLITGKGDAMSGGGSVRTTYKGKATFDDIISRATLYTGIAFMVLVLCYQVLNRPSTSVKVPTSSAPASTPVEANIPVAPATNVPATNTPAPNTAAPSAPATNTPAAPAAAGTNAPKAP